MKKIRHLDYYEKGGGVPSADGTRPKKEAEGGQPNRDGDTRIHSLCNTLTLITNFWNRIDCNASMVILPFLDTAILPWVNVRGDR